MVPYVSLPRNQRAPALGLGVMHMGKSDDDLIDMHMNRYKYFRWTPRTVKLTFWYVFAVPTALGYLAYKTEVYISFVQ